MNYKISKELFEAVMSLKVIEFYCRNEIQYYPADKERVRCIDWIPALSSCEYNDFFFKCKEWAYNQGYIIYSSTKSCSMFKKEAQLYCSNENIQEQQKIFDVCQWILNNKDKQ